MTTQTNGDDRLERESPRASTLQGTVENGMKAEDETYLDKEREGCGAVATTPPEIDQPLDDFPDGGFRAWLIVLGATCNNTATFGFVNSWGVFQTYYETHTLSTTSPSTIAWIGSVQYALVFLPGLVTGRLFDIGLFKLPFAIASVLLVVTTMLIGECTQFWQFFLCQGLAVGLACGTIFGPTMGVLSHWFKRRRATAVGVAAIGSSLGGTVFPIVFRQLIDKVGFAWTVRVLGFMLLFFLTISNLTLVRRLPPVRRPGGFLDLRSLRNRAFAVYCVAGFFSFLGLYTLLTYVELSAEQVGIDAGFSFYLIAIANASSSFGRLSSGILADKFGAVNVMIPFTTVAGLITYIWPFVKGVPSFTVVCIIYGFSSGAFVSLIVNPVIVMGDIEDVGRRVGLYFTIDAIGALAGPPISGAINAATGAFHAVGIYAGTMVMIGVLLMIVTRQLVLKGRITGKF